MKKLQSQPFESKLAWLTVILCAVGLILLSSASNVISLQRFGSQYFYLTRQAIFVGVGLVAMLLVSKINYHFYKRIALILLGLIVLLLATVLIPGIGFTSGEARSWFNFGVFFLQPAEFAKLALIIYLATYIEAKGEMMKSFFHGLLPSLAITGAVAGLILVQPDFGGTAAIILIAFSIYFAGSVRITHLLALVTAGLIASYALIKAAPYRLARFSAFLDPTLDPLGIGYHINQALLAVGSGGLWGYGFGQSRQKFNFLPEPIGDSVFAITAEELGFLRVAVLLTLFCLFAVLGYGVARKAPDTFGMLLAVGITSWVVIQVVFDIGAMVNILPLTGITLPFISYGGSSIIALLIGVGILLNISRQRI